MVDWLLPLLTFSSIFERFNIFVSELDFALKLSLILFPLVALILLFKRKLTFNPSFLFPFLLLVLAVEALSIPFSYNRFQSSQVVVFHLLMVGLFYLFVWGIHKVRDWDRVVVGWGAGSLLASLYGFWQFGRHLLGQSPAIFLENFLAAKSLPAATFIHRFLGRNLLRPSSTFIDTTTAASFVAVAIFFSLVMFLTVKNKRQRLLFLFVLVAGLGFFALTFSRSAILGLGAGLVLFIALNLKERIDKRVVGGILVALAILSATVALLSFSRIRAVSNAIRLEIAQGAIEMYRESPLIGVGVGNFESYYTEVLRPGESHGYSHSIFLTWMGETGTLGLLANISLIGVTILFLMRETLQHRLRSRWRLRLSALLAAFVSLVAANIFHAHYGLEFTWVLLGLCVSGYYLARGSHFADEGKKTVDILGVQVDNVDMGAAMQKVKSFFRGKKKAHVVTPNPEMVILARSDPFLAEVLNKADLSIPDGIGLIWASRVLGTPLKKRVTGVDLFFELCAEVARRDGKIFLLGGREGVAEKAAHALKSRYPKLRIVGTFAGDGSRRGDKETVQAIRKAAKGMGGKEIDFLFVAYSHGKPERWIGRNLEKIPVKVAMGVGGTFDFAAGEVPRAPRFVQQLGLEWFFRLFRQPWRVRRQLALISFIFLVFKEFLFPLKKSIKLQHSL